LRRKEDCYAAPMLFETIIRQPMYDLGQAIKEKNE
jgi:hypothetical protein